MEKFWSIIATNVSVLYYIYCIMINKQSISGQIKRTNNSKKKV